MVDKQVLGLGEVVEARLSGLTKGEQCRVEDGDGIVDQGVYPLLFLAFLLLEPPAVVRCAEAGRLAPFLWMKKW